MSSFIDKIRRLERLDTLIRRKGTGRPTELARRLGISESCLYKYLNYLKELGAEIDYCNYRQSYTYKESFVIKIGEERQLRVWGGQSSLACYSQSLNYDNCRIYSLAHTSRFKNLLLERTLGTQTRFSIH